MKFQEERCYMCGAVGFEELLVACLKCKSAFIHVYCMETIQLVPPDDWVCEDCPKTPKHVASKFSVGERVCKRPVKFIPTDEAIALASPPLLPKSSDSCKDTLKANKKAGKRKRLSDEQMKMDRYLPNPLSFATWKGSFRTSGFAAPLGSLDAVWGYPPAKLGQKAFEFIKKMPNVLHFEAIPRCTVWEKMFNDRGPNKYDVGLYFFPVGDRTDRCYSCLVAHLEKQDIVLKSCINGIQLLIFSSSHLDEKSTKMNQAYYLWGLFVAPGITFNEPKQKQLLSKTNTDPSIQHAPENEQAVDMEIDMLGGAHIGKIDAPIPRDFPLIRSINEQTVDMGIDTLGGSPIGNIDAAIQSPLDCSKKSKDAAKASQPVPYTQVKPEKCDNDDLVSPPRAWLEPRVPPGFEDMIGGSPIGNIDVSILSCSNKKVKPEKWDGDGLAWLEVEPRVPPGFEETGRVKYKTMNELYCSPEMER